MNNIAAKTIMEFEEKNNRIITTKAYHEGNARISAPMPINEKSPYYFLITMGGGFVEGEHYLVDINVKDRASALLTSQSPTYIFRSINNQTISQEVNLNVENKATLEFLMDDLLPYKDSIFRQNTKINLKKDSNLIYLDGITAGWSPEDKPFSYKSVYLNTKIYMEEKLIVCDHFLSEPNKYPNLNKLGLFEEYTNYNTLFVINKKIDLTYIEEIRELVSSLKVDASFGISKLEVPGFAVRILGKTMDDNKKIIFSCANKVRQDLFGFPCYSLRKNDFEEMIV